MILDNTKLYVFGEVLPEFVKNLYLSVVRRSVLAVSWLLLAIFRE